LVNYFPYNVHSPSSFQRGRAEIADLLAMVRDTRFTAPRIPLLRASSQADLLDANCSFPLSRMVPASAPPISVMEIASAPAGIFSVDPILVTRCRLYLSSRRFRYREPKVFATNCRPSVAPFSDSFCFLPITVFPRKFSARCKPFHSHLRPFAAVSDPGRNGRGYRLAVPRD